MRKRLQRIALSLVNAKYSVSSWLWVVVSFFAALIMLLQLLSNTPGTLEFGQNLFLFNPIVWVILLLLSSIVKMVGMAMRNLRIVGWGAFWAFVLWVFGVTAFLATGGVTTVILLVTPIIIFNAWLFIGTRVREGNNI